jgi:beta-N-acetylhexosaminidase
VVARRRRRVAVAACVAFAAGLATAVVRGGDPDAVTYASGTDESLLPVSSATRSEVASLGARTLAGQRVIVGFSGPDVPGWLRDAIEGGDIGGVVLFSGNVASSDQVRKLTARLQGIDRPLTEPLLVMVDQEGGEVKRLPGPPDMSAAQMGRAGAAVAGRQGSATGRSLETMGVNVDLAPVADVARSGSNLEQDGRAFGSEPAAVARLSTAFLDGVQDSRVAATAKHFPGFGAARLNTDDARVVVDLSKRKLRRVDGPPFAAAIDAGVRLVMVDTVIYPALDPKFPAALSPRIASGELRGRYGFNGVSVTDALGTPAVAPYGGPGRLALRCAKAGMDLMLYAGRSGLNGSQALAQKLRSGKLDRGEFEASVARVLSLRGQLAG